MNKYDKMLGSQSGIGRVARKITDTIGAKGVRQAAGDYAAGRKVNKTNLALGLGATALAVTGAVGLGRTAAKITGSKLTGKLISSKHSFKLRGNKNIKQKSPREFSDWQEVQRERQSSGLMEAWKQDKKMRRK